MAASVAALAMLAARPGDRRNLGSVLSHSPVTGMLWPKISLFAAATLTSYP